MACTALKDELLQMVFEVTLANTHMNQCASMWCIACVGPNGTHDMAYGVGSGYMGRRREKTFLNICASSG